VIHCSGIHGVQPNKKSWKIFLLALEPTGAAELNQAHITCIVERLRTLFGSGLRVFPAARAIYRATQNGHQSSPEASACCFCAGFGLITLEWSTSGLLLYFL